MNRSEITIGGTGATEHEYTDEHGNTYYTCQHTWRTDLTKVTKEAKDE